MVVCVVVIMIKCESLRFMLKWCREKPNIDLNYGLLFPQVEEHAQSPTSESSETPSLEFESAAQPAETTRLAKKTSLWLWSRIRSEIGTPPPPPELLQTKLLIVRAVCRYLRGKDCGILWHVCGFLYWAWSSIILFSLVTSCYIQSL